MHSRDPSFWVWAEALELLHGAHPWQREFFAGASGRSALASGWSPPVDMFERDGRLTVQVALPGVDPAQVDVTLRDAGIVVRGERPLPWRAGGATVHRVEIPYGHFERRIMLPPGNFSLLEQRRSDGCLTLVFGRG